MEDDNGLDSRVYEASAFGDHSRSYGPLSDRIREFGPSMTARQQECLVELARVHIGGQQGTKAKWDGCHELTKAIGWAFVIGFEPDGDELWLWAEDCLIFKADSSECKCATFIESGFCQHLMALALMQAGNE